MKFANLKRTLFSFCSTRGGYLLGLYLIFVLFFFFWRVGFLLFNIHLWPDASIVEASFALLQGFKLDSVVAAYALPIPFLAILLLYALPRHGVGLFLRIYYIAIALLLSLIFTSDLLLYGYWNFRLDSTPLFYLRQPQGALDSVSLWLILGALFLWLFSTLILSWLLLRWHKHFFPNSSLRRPYALIYTPAYIVMGGAIFLLIRGGISVATANVGMVYHSSKSFLNHAAINPAFNLIYSLLHDEDLCRGYLFFDEKTLAKHFEPLKRQSEADTDPKLTDSLLCTSRPNIILILMESFSANPVGCLGSTQGLTPAIDRLADEGVLFEQTYANSFRTDRGMVSILSAFPAQPNTSITKYPSKSQQLPSIARALSTAGYSSQMLYGGDIDFASMRSYLMATGYEQITDIKSFDMVHKLSKWGVPDEITMDYLAEDYLRLCKVGEPIFYTLLSLSSHEPFDVPIQRHKHPYLNSIAYTDQAIGTLIARLKKSDQWDNTLLILIGDHGYPYPEKIATPDRPEKYRILHLWAGGCIRQPKRINTICSQTDLAATLLAQLGLKHKEMIYSKNILSSQVEPFAFFCVPNLFGFVDQGGITTWDCDSRSVLYNDGKGQADRIRKGQAYLQSLLLDMSHR